jgi:DNA invertase Pin-like site-specific DNA recombinase
MPDILGYARVSTEGQDLEGQRQRLREVGALKIFEDVISGKIFIRNGLENLIAYANFVAQILNLPLHLFFRRYGLF